MQKFDMGAAWDDAKLLLGAHSGLIWAVAGVFIFLPQLLMELVVGQPPTMPASGTATEADVARMMEWLMKASPLLLLMAVAAMAGTIAIMRLWLARTSVSVGEALMVGLTLIPTLFVAQVITGLLSGAALILLIIPGLYLYARFIAIGPIAADLKIFNPIRLITGSWELTKNRGFSILLYLVLVLIAALIVYILAASVVMLVLGWVPSVGATLVTAVTAALSTVFSVFVVSITTSIYRQLVAINGDVLNRI
jgi:hypothetical protein